MYILTSAEVHCLHSQTLW